MSKQQLSVILIALASILLLSNWGAISDKTAASLREESVRPKKVVYWSSSGSPEAERKQANDFMADPEYHDVLIKPNFRETGGLQDILFVSFLSGNPPDFLDVQYSEIRKFVLIGAVRPIDDLIEKAGGVEAYTSLYMTGPSRLVRFNVNPDDRFFERDESGNFLYPLEAARLLEMNGKIVGLQTIDTPSTLTYNKRIFREAAAMFPDAGLIDGNGEPVPPRTWLEFYETARVITEYGKAIAKERGLAEPATYGAVFQGQSKTDLYRGIGPLAASSGSMAFNYNGSTERVQSHFDPKTDAAQRLVDKVKAQPIGFYEYESAPMIGAFALQYKMKEDGLTLPGMEARHYEDARTALAAGQAGMILDGAHAAMIGAERVPWASRDLASAPIPVSYATQDLFPEIGADEEKHQRQAIHKLLALDEVGVELPPPNRVPRSASARVKILTSSCRFPEATWAWLHAGEKKPELMKAGTRRGIIPDQTEILAKIDDPEWFPFTFQKQIYTIIKDKSSLWPAIPTYSAQPSPRKGEAYGDHTDTFYKYFYKDTDDRLADVLKKVREELCQWSDDVNFALAKRIEDGETLPSEWTFPTFNALESDQFYALQQSFSADPANAKKLARIRTDLVANLASRPVSERAGVLDDEGDIREDIWTFQSSDSPMQVLWIPAMLLFTIALWFVTMAIRNGRNKEPWLRNTMREARTNVHGYVFVLPGLLLIFTFAIYASFYQFHLSVHSGDGLAPMKYVGMDNFAKLLNPSHPQFDQVFWEKVLPNTAMYMIVVTVGQITVGMFIACLLNMPLRANNVYRVLFFIPLVTSLATVSVVLLGLLKGQDSGINQWLISVGLQDLPYHLGLVDEAGKAHNWLGGKTDLGVLMVVAIWHGLPYTIIILLAGLQSISPDLYEAARVDGASAPQRFRHITLPEISPILLILAFQSFVGAAKAFSLVLVLTEGGTDHSSDLAAHYIFSWGFLKPENQEPNLGYASAVGIIYSLILVALTATNVVIVARRWRARLSAEHAAAKGGVA